MSGKNILRKMIDGHVEVLCNPIHDMISNVALHDTAKDHFLRRRNRSYLSIQPYLPYLSIIYNSGDKADIDIGDFFYALYRFCAFKSLHSFALGKTVFVKSKEGFMEELPFSFDFSGFVHSLNSLFFGNQKTLTVEQLLDAIYGCYDKNWLNKPYHTNDYWFLDTLSNGHVPIENVINNISNCKILVMDRDPVSLLFANAVRIHSVYDDGITINNYFRKVLFNQRTFIKKIRLFRKELASLQRDNNNLFIVDFNELILNTEKTMKNISSFLGIEFNDILLKPSLCSDVLNNTKYPIIGDINDDPHKFLNQDDLDLLYYLYNGMDEQNTAYKNAKIFFRALRWHHMIVFKSWLSKILLKILPKVYIKSLKDFVKR